MKKEEIDKWTEKYEAAESSLAEEKLLINHAEKINSAYTPWFKFIQRNKQSAPQNLNASIWNAVQKQSNSKRRLSIGIISAAASVLIILSVFVFNPSKNKLSYQEKAALLNEALSMFNNDAAPAKTAQNVLYEDDMIVIYTTPK